MISVLTLTYQRHALLEEAMESFLRQDFPGESEMVVVNDSPNFEYGFEHPKIRILNLKKRFPSIGQKLKFGFSQCRYDYIYRLDDDDLLTPWALRDTWEDIVSHPGYDVYRSNGHYYSENNQFIKIYGSVNNGNVYTKKYLSRIEIPDRSFGEDSEMTFHNDAGIYTSPRERKTMIYRWGMNTFHVSGMGDIGNDAIANWTDRLVRPEERENKTGSEKGILMLRPHFEEDTIRLIREVSQK